MLFLSCSRSTIASTFPDFYFIPNGISLSNCPHHLFFAGFVSNLQLDIFIIMSKGITKLKNILEGLPEPLFSSKDYMMLYINIYHLCTEKPPHDYSQQLYDKYKEVFEEYIQSTVLPSLREKHDEFMLRELVKSGFVVSFTIWIATLLPGGHPPLHEVGLTCFRDRVMLRRTLHSVMLILSISYSSPCYKYRQVLLCYYRLDVFPIIVIPFFHNVYKELNGKVRDAVIFIVGEQIDRALLKNVLDIFVEIGMGQMDHYENDFESAMLKDTSAYYSQKASNWILEDSCPDYTLKVAHYLHSSSEPKLLEKVQHELLSVYANQLLQKEHSGCHALLRDDKVEDLSRMFMLFSKIPEGLDPVSSIFKQHVITEGMVLVKQAEDAASTKRDFVWKMIELHDKYLAYALKESFEVFCNKGVAESWSAELLATFSDDNILIANCGGSGSEGAKVNSSELTTEAKLESAKADNQKLRDMVKVANQEKEATDRSRLQLEVKLREEKLKLEKVGLGALQGIDQAVANLKAQIQLPVPDFDPGKLVIHGDVDPRADAPAQAPPA
ncbi:hypothetical protein Ahy_A08g037557 [Arachis hypogaea]|uniref:Cullin N-terminal domain-containing protein n=1 Tax=Arachis hypogaea TaxID=3818 RepID=A0A445BR99_ARAHY|nr:hypothetical protein Ahy_A08g037557 [Arachis hypogaea]